MQLLTARTDDLYT